MSSQSQLGGGNNNSRRFLSEANISLGQALPGKFEDPILGNAFGTNGVHIILPRER